MKRLLICFVPAFLCYLLLAGCSSAGEGTAAPDAPVTSWEVTEDITISLKDSTFPVGTTEFTAVFENRGTTSLLYGEEISFEKLVDGQWQKVETIENYGFNSIGYLLQGGETKEFTISTWFLAKPLDMGRYRIIGSNLYPDAPGSTPGQYPPYQLEFDIQ